jgi:gamma-glutamyltranspeptidase
MRRMLLGVLAALLVPLGTGRAQQTAKPVLHGRHWVAITGKPLAATAGAMTFQKGGNAVDAACAMLAATATMWDVLSWGGETQALIYNPRTGKVVGINALGVAPSGATVDFYKSKGMKYPPEYGPLAAVTPGTPGGLLVMLAEYGKLSLAEVLAPAIQPFLSFAVQGGDSQDQNLLQFFLNVVEFGMNVQQAAEAANFNSFQMRTSFGDHGAKPGRLLLHEETPPWTRTELKRLGYELTFEPRTSGPINAIYFDREHGTFWGGSSHHGEDYGIAW